MNDLEDPTSDTAELVDNEGDLGVTYRLQRSCCGGKRRLLIILLALLLVTGIAIALAVFLTMSKYPVYNI